MSWFAVEAENFERPIRFLQKDFHPGLFLVSENWFVVEDHGNPVYIPKAKVRKIEMLMEPVEFGPELSGDGNTYTHFYNYFVFTCDEKHAFATGLILRSFFIDSVYPPIGGFGGFGGSCFYHSLQNNCFSHNR